MTGAVPVIELRGDPVELGQAHGAAVGERLRAFLADSLCRLNRLLPKPVSAADLAPAIDAHRKVIRAAVPDLAAEIDGLAQGASITEDEAYLLQIRREVLGYHRIPTMGDCTTYARAGVAAAGSPVLAQTVDLNGDLDDQLAVLRTAPHGKRRSAVLSFGGQLGYLGLNDAGVAVGINLVLGGEWRPGVPPYLAVRHVLDTAASTREAIRILRSLPLAGSRSLTVCDADTVAVAEFADGEFRVDFRAESSHTNHFLDPDLARSDELNVFALASSRRRLGACRDRLAALAATAAPDEHFALMSEAPINVADVGDIRVERTVAAAVLLPAKGELHLRRGDPAKADGRMVSVPVAEMSHAQRGRSE